MSDAFTAALTWTRTTPDFAYDTYSRDHALVLGSGTRVDSSAAAEFKGNPQRTNPEEQLVAALSSCHMLTFLAIAAKKRLVVNSYIDSASGVLAKDAEGKLAVTAVTLRPQVVFAPETPVDAPALSTLHAQAHSGCFIANSVHTVVTITPQG